MTAYEAGHEAPFYKLSEGPQCYQTEGFQPETGIKNYSFRRLETQMEKIGGKKKLLDTGQKM